MRSKATASTLYREIGRAIHKLRTKRKLSQKDIAAEVRISRASVANIEQGRHRIQLHVLYDIAAALEVEPRDLLPHAQGSRAVQSLPEDISKRLKTPKEAMAVSRLLADGKGDAHGES